MISKNTRNNLRRFKKLVFIEKSRFLLAAFFLAVNTALSFVTPLYPKFFIDNVLTAGPVKGIYYLKILILVMALCFVVSEISSLIYRYLIFLTQNKIAFKLELKLFRHIVNFPISFFKDTGTGYAMSRVSTDVSRMQGLMTRTTLDIFSSIVSLVVGFGIAFYLSWKLTILCSLILPVFIFSIMYFSEKTKKKSEELMEVYAKKGSVLQEVFTGIFTVKSFVLETIQIKKLGQALKNIIKKQFSWELIGYLSSLSLSLVAVAGPLLIFWFGGREVILKHITLGTLISFTVLLGYILNPIRQLVNINTSVQNSLGALDRIYEYLDMPTELTRDSKKSKDKIISAEKSAYFPKEIIFNNLSFAYDKDKPGILKNINFGAKTGEIIVFVGKSGSGKTTLCNLLPRFYEPSNGEILFDGENIKNIELRNLRRIVSVVPQDTFVFSGTIKENIKAVRAGATDEELISVCGLLGLDDKEKNLPDGLNTKIGSQGSKLSGGQKQRISIARALLKESNVLILDEATSQLDTISESKIRKIIDAIAKDKIVFVIAHRLSLVKSAHKIIVMDKGEIIDSGSHVDLYQRCVLYRELCKEYLYE